MPRPRNLKSLFLDVVVFVSMFALLGHLSMNFWERFVIQTELTNMKTSLHSLKETITRIGCAYDNLHKELVGLVMIADDKIKTKTSNKEDPEVARKKRTPNKPHHDMKVQALLKADHMTLTAPTLHNKTVQNLIQNMKQDKVTQNFLQEKKKTPRLGKNVSTITRYPPKSTGVGVIECEKLHYQCPNEENCRYKSYMNKCCKEYEYYNSPNNWRF